MRKVRRDARLGEEAMLDAKLSELFCRFRVLKDDIKMRIS